MDAAPRIPVRTAEGSVGPDGTVSIRRQKAGRLGTAFLRAFRVEPTLTVHLDAIGSEVWSLIDGRRTGAQILAALKAAHPEEDDLPRRLGAYLSSLARNRLIRLE